MRTVRGALSALGAFVIAMFLAFVFTSLLYLALAIFEWAGLIDFKLADDATGDPVSLGIVAFLTLAPLASDSETGQTSKSIS